MRREAKRPLLVGSYIGIPINFHEGQASSPVEALNSACLARLQKDVRPPVHKSGDLGLSLESAQGIQTSLSLVR